MNWILLCWLAFSPSTYFLMGSAGSGVQAAEFMALGDSFRSRSSSVSSNESMITNMHRDSWSERQSSKRSNACLYEADSVDHWMQQRGIIAVVEETEAARRQFMCASKASSIETRDTDDSGSHVQQSHKRHKSSSGPEFARTSARTLASANTTISSAPTLYSESDYEQPESPIPDLDASIFMSDGQFFMSSANLDEEEDELFELDARKLMDEPISEFTYSLLAERGSLRTLPIECDFMCILAVKSSSASTSLIEHQPKARPAKNPQSISELIGSLSLGEKMDYD